MTETITLETKKLLKQLSHFQLYKVSFVETNWSVNLTFVFDNNTKDIIIELFNIIHLTMSKTIDDNDGCYMVGEVTITRVNDGGAKILSSLRYPLKNLDQNVLYYRSRSLFHLHLEGDMCLDIICGDFTIGQK